MKKFDYQDALFAMSVVLGLTVILLRLLNFIF